MMKYIEKRPIIMIAMGIVGISLSSIFVKYAQAPSAVTAAWRLLWTVLLMTPAVAGSHSVREEFRCISRPMVCLSVLSGICLALHFTLWFESLQHTSVASSTTIVCTEVIWVSLGYCLFLKGKLTGKARVAICITLAGSLLIAWSDSSSGGSSFYGDMLALLAAIAVAAYVLLGRIVRQKLSTTTYTYIVYMACTGALLLLCAAQRTSLVGYGKTACIVGFLLAVFSTILGHSIFSWCLKYFSPAFVSASKLCEPVLAGLMAGFLFEEIPSALQLAGSSLILLGVCYYSGIESKENRDAS